MNRTEKIVTSRPIKIVKKLLLILAFTTTPVFSGQVIGIADGDTLTVLHDRHPMTIRLAGVDAPEKAQAFGQQSKQSLSNMCFGKDATYQIADIDRYGRTVAVVICDGINVNQAQVQRGFAWVYTRYNKDRLLPSLEAGAKKAKVGLWGGGNPTPPWLFRRQATITF